MQKILNTAVFAFLLCVCIACKKSGNNVTPVSITGKWTFQSNNMTIYINGQQQAPSTLLPVVSILQFNADNTFTETYNCQGVLDTTSGQYSVSGKAIVFSNYKSKYTYVTAPFGEIVPSPLPLFSAKGSDFSALAISIQITDLSANSLAVHTELIDKATSGSAYREVLEQGYTR